MKDYAVRANAAGITIFDPEQGAFSVHSDHPDFEEIKSCIAVEDYGEAIYLIDKAKKVKSFLSNSGLISIDPLTRTATMPNGQSIPTQVMSKVDEMVDAGAAPGPLERFLFNLQRNPAPHAWRETLLFADANGFQIFEDGTILGYKAVTPNFKDKRTQKIDNSVGTIVEMPRHDVDDDRRVSCSTGLHVAAHEYALMFGNHTDPIVVVKVNPADIVSIPYDYNNQKMRCCRYKVLATLDPRETELANDAGVFRTRDIEF